MKKSVNELKIERIKYLDDWAKKGAVKHSNCQQPIQYTSNCQNIHIYNICAEYPAQFCNVCLEHWSNCYCSKK